MKALEPGRDLSSRSAHGWKDLVIDVSEEELPSFLQPTSPRKTPDDEPIELDLAKPAFGAQKKIGRRKRLVDRQILQTRTGTVKVRSTIDTRLYSPDDLTNGSDLLVASIFNDESVIAPARTMPARRTDANENMSRGDWSEPAKEVPEGIYLQSHVTAPRMMVVAEVATTSAQMLDQKATVTKFIMGFDDHADVSLFPKSLLPKNFNKQSINANDGVVIRGVTGNSLTNAGTLSLKVFLGDTWFRIKFQICDNVLAYPLIGNDFRSAARCSMDWDNWRFVLEPPGLKKIFVPLYEPPVVLQAK